LWLTSREPRELFLWRQERMPQNTRVERLLYDIPYREMRGRRKRGRRGDGFEWETEKERETERGRRERETERGRREREREREKERKKRGEIWTRWTWQNREWNTIHYGILRNFIYSAVHMKGASLIRLIPLQKSRPGKNHGLELLLVSTI
jgi:hypothetical protein